ncbi:hypothetical protein [Frigidibacter sp.]|uniref:hypothetical protein n=1 Tax=Frigidibacter sp. TaxID=2586418 RepID=UPI0027341CB5|nr:hypothetical protein [Frigidibacter sp.]MDP3339943.1 hypothetical protein [Frigidibacter sp.]
MFSAAPNRLRAGWRLFRVVSGNNLSNLVNLAPVFARPAFAMFSPFFTTIDAALRHPIGAKPETMLQLQGDITQGQGRIWSGNCPKMPGFSGISPRWQFFRFGNIQPPDARVSPRRRPDRRGGAAAICHG